MVRQNIEVKVKTASGKELCIKIGVFLD